VRRTILFLEQQTWRSGAQRVLEELLGAVAPEYRPLVVFPSNGPFVEHLRKRGVETMVVPLGSYRSGRKSLGDLLAFPIRSLYCGLKLRKVIAQNDVRLVYINAPRWLVAGVLAARLTGVPGIYHQHLTLSRRPDLFVAHHAGRHATRIVACSHAAADALARGNAGLRSKTRVVYNPVCRPSPPGASLPEAGTIPFQVRARCVIGQVGRITPEKKQHNLLRAAARLVGNGRDIQVVFVGAPEPDNRADQDYERFLKSVVRDLGLDGRVHWAGYVSDPSPFYSKFDAMALPSTFGEGLPLAALEAMQQGVPVVGTRIGGIPEVIKDGINGFLIPPDDVEMLAACLERILSDAELRARLRAGALATVDERFSVETFGAMIRQIVSEISPEARQSK